MDGAILRKIADAIWSAKGTPMRLLDEICSPDSNLHRQQTQCWKEAKAVYVALFS